jgi:hypothetical protein
MLLSLYSLYTQYERGGSWNFRIISSTYRCGRWRAGGQSLAAGVGVVERGGRRKKKNSSFILRRDSNQLQLYFGFDFFGIVCTHTLVVRFFGFPCSFLI